MTWCSRCTAPATLGFTAKNQTSSCTCVEELHEKAMALHPRAAKS